MMENLSKNIENSIRFQDAAAKAVKGFKPGKVKRFVCPVCGAMSLAKRDANGHVRAFCQGCGISGIS